MLCLAKSPEAAILSVTLKIDCYLNHPEGVSDFLAIGPRLPGESLQSEGLIARRTGAHEGRAHDAEVGHFMAGCGPSVW